MTAPIRVTHSAGSIVRRALPFAALLVALSACSSLLDVKNPNNVPEDALANASAAAAEASGVLASLVRMLSGVTVPYAVATDELDWIGSRDAWNDLETGAIANYLNEFNDGVFGYVGEVRYLGDAVIGRLEKFNAAGALRDKQILTRTYIYTAIAYATIADMYDDYAFSTKTVAAAPIGRAAMGTLYDKAVGYLDKAQALAGPDSLKYQILAFRARVKHAKGVWGKITPKGQTPANPLVNDAGSVTDATAALDQKLSGGDDAKFLMKDNIEATAGINIWYEVYGRNEHQVGKVYTNLIDPISGVKDPTVQGLLAAFKGFGIQSGVFTITSNRELRLILAEAALAGGNTAEFTNQINLVRALDGKPAYSGQIPAVQMLAYERKAQTWLMRRRLSDMYRFGEKDSHWAANPNFESAFNVPGLLFPIPNVERLGNPCITNPAACK